MTSTPAAPLTGYTEDNTMTIRFTKRPQKMSKQAFQDFNSKHSEILDHTFKSYNVAYMGERNTNDWAHDSFLVSINGFDFSYSTGLGHRTEERRLRLVHAPIIDDVLYSLVTDASCALETFGDFCENLGYDEDSRKALDIYLECQKTANKMHRLLPLSLDDAQELFSDY
jgi:hypothetical protein